MKTKFLKKTEDGITHYYRVSNGKVLHLNSAMPLINDLDEISSSRALGLAAECSREEFETEIKRLIYELEIDTYFYNQSPSH